MYVYMESFDFIPQHTASPGSRFFSSLYLLHAWLHHDLNITQRMHTWDSINNLPVSGVTHMSENPGSFLAASRCGFLAACGSNLNTSCRCRHLDTQTVS